jgi:hypothetical protein
MIVDNSCRKSSTGIAPGVHALSHSARSPVLRRRGSLVIRHEPGYLDEDAAVVEEQFAAVSPTSPTSMALLHCDLWESFSRVIQSKSMTWWSEQSAVPGFVLAKLAIRCRFVDRFVGSRVPSRVSGQRLAGW